MTEPSTPWGRPGSQPPPPDDSTIPAAPLSPAAARPAAEPPADTDVTRVDHAPPTPAGVATPGPSAPTGGGPPDGPDEAPPAMTTRGAATWIAVGGVVVLVVVIAVLVGLLALRSDRSEDDVVAGEGGSTTRRSTTDGSDATTTPASASTGSTTARPSVTTAPATTTPTTAAPTTSTRPPTTTAPPTTSAPPPTTSPTPSTISPDDDPPNGLLCRDLAGRGLDYPTAVAYWFQEGQPERMDADLNGIPCETVYPVEDVSAYWSTTDPATTAALPGGLLCEDLDARELDYPTAVAYWYQEGVPDRMDADLNGIPCETVYPAGDVDAYWGT